MQRNRIKVRKKLWYSQWCELLMTVFCRNGGFMRASSSCLPPSGQSWPIWSVSVWTTRQPSGLPVAVLSVSSTVWSLQVMMSWWWIQPINHMSTCQVLSVIRLFNYIRKPKVITDVFSCFTQTMWYCTPLSPSHRAPCGEPSAPLNTTRRCLRRDTYATSPLWEK